VISTELSSTPALLTPDVIVALLVLVVLVLIGIAGRLFVVRQRQREEEREHELPPLVYPARRVDPEEAERVRRELAIRAGHEHVAFDSSAEAGTSAREPAPAPAPVAGRSNGDGRNGAGAAAELDTTLQLLPGRLEPADPGTEQEIRFVRLPGSKRFTFGRNEGPAHTHIQLHAATASRMHAFMEFDGGRWHLGNMSRTNRVVVNGAPLHDEVVHALADGDRIEFGELAFVFRVR
jgi:hypothetical protein